MWNLTGKDVGVDDDSESVDDDDTFTYTLSLEEVLKVSVQEYVDFSGVYK